MKEDILLYLFENDIGEKIPLNNFLKSLLKSDNQKILQPLLHPLEKEGLVDFEGQVGHIGTSQHTLEEEEFKGMLTAAGIGEAKEITRRIRQDTLIERQTIVSESVGQSVIETNNNQMNFSKRSLWLAGISTFFILVTIILSIFDKTPERLSNIEQALRKQDSTLKNIQTSLEKLNPIIKSVPTDTILWKKK